MTTDAIDTARSGWHPIASLDELVPYHVHQAMLGGIELAVWRGEDGFVNVWENRCLHRGVRLSIGSTDGAELKCAYHGWRYANRSGGCTYVPAHPADAPSRTVCTTTFPAIERAGLVWTTLGHRELPPEAIGEPDGKPAPLPLRPLPVHAPLDAVVDALAHHRFAPPEALDATEPEMVVAASDRTTVTVTSTVDGTSSEVVFHVQPVDIGRCVVRGVLTALPATELLGPVLRHHNERLSALREMIERTADQSDYVDPALRPPIPRKTPVGLVTGRRLAPLRVRVRRKWHTATDIVAIELEPVVDASLPTAPAGAHIDLHLPNSLVRQYSLTNGPGQSEHYRIGVKRVADSRGGSAYIHDQLEAGDELSISEPRPSFPLRRDATRCLLIAGGIGVTPLLSMAQTLVHGGLPVELHYFARGQDHLAFPEVRDQLGSVVSHHVGLDAVATVDRLRQVIGSHARTHHAYICGPPPMLESARSIARDLGWPDDAVHFEYFGNTAEVDRSSTFEVDLARSGTTLTVHPGQSILDVLQEAKVAISSSCEQGACGTCVATVIDGEPDHQDVRLSAAERAAGDRIMTCVSRARSPRLILDL